MKYLLMALAVFAAAITASPSMASPDKPGRSPSLHATPFYTCVRSFYVATTGSDSNPGTEALPWLTIQNADSSSRQPGDCIIVEPGIYQKNILIQHGGNAPTPTGYVVYRCKNVGQCHVLAPGGGHLWGIEKGGSFLVIDGFEIDGTNALKTNGIADSCIGSDGDTYGTGNSSHHLWVLNNIIHHCNLAGIDFNNKEWYYIIHNTIYHNSWTSGYQGSGIGLVVVQCIESGNPACASGNTYAGGTGNYTPSGMDLTYMPPYHIVVMENNVFDNMVTTAAVACGQHTDGNGIIMDTFLDETTHTIAFPFQTLIFGNLSDGNGGRGIHVFNSSNVTVANNTVYGNGTDTCLMALYIGDLSLQGGQNDVFINNISQSILTSPHPQGSSYPGCVQGGTNYCGGRNSPLLAGNGAYVTDLNNTFSNNITEGGLGVQTFNSDMGHFSCSNNMCNTDAKLTGPRTNYALQGTSPALGYVITGHSLPTTPTFAGTCATATSYSDSACPY